MTASRGHSYVLDTHAWFWLATGDAELKRHRGCLPLFEKASEGSFTISAITPWEISMLEAKGRMILKTDCLTWLNESIRRTAVLVAAISPEIAVDATHLPGECHGDPADRLIIATARCHRSVLLTRDRQILNYAKAGFVTAQEV